MIRSGRATGTTNGAIRAAVERAASRLPLELRDLVHSELRSVAQNASASWPVKTGRSAASIATRASHSPSVVGGEVTAIEYARTARYGAGSPLHGLSIWEHLIGRPIHDAVARVATEAGRRVANAIGGR
jgi:hypothetical protein